MKILLISDDPTIHTGYGINAYILASRLMREGHIVEQIAIFGSKNRDYSKIPFKVYPCEDISDFLNKEYRNIVYSYAPDIIIYDQDIWLIGDFKIDCGAKHIFYLHLEGEPLQKYFRSYLGITHDYVKFLNLFDDIVCIGNYTKRVLEDAFKKYNLPCKCNTVINESVNPNIFKPLDYEHIKILKKKWFNLKDDDFLIGYFGRQNARKCIPYALEAFSKWNKPNTYFYIHCDLKDKYGWDLKTLVEDLNIKNKVIFNDKISVIKGVTEYELNELYNACDITINTSLGEGFSKTTCIPKNTIVRMAHGYKPVQNIKIGDLVLTKEEKLAPVENIKQIPYIDKLVKIKLSNNEVFECTSDEKIFCYNIEKSIVEYVNIDTINENEYNYDILYPLTKEYSERYTEILREKKILTDKYENILNIKENFTSHTKRDVNITHVNKYYYISEFKDLDIIEYKGTEYCRRSIKSITSCDNNSDHVYSLTIANQRNYLVEGNVCFHNCESLYAGTPVIITDYSELQQYEKGVIKLKPIIYYYEIGTNIKRALVGIDDIIEGYERLYDNVYRDILSKECEIYKDIYNPDLMIKKWVNYLKKYEYKLDDIDVSIRLNYGKKEDFAIDGKIIKELVYKYSGYKYYKTNFIYNNNTMYIPHNNNINVPLYYVNNKVNNDKTCYLNNVTYKFKGQLQNNILSSSEEKNISFIIVTKDRFDLIQPCVSSLLNCLERIKSKWEIIIVDTGSNDMTVLAYYNELSKNPNIRIIFDERYNYSFNNNNGVKLAKYEYICLLNNDIYFKNLNAIKEIISLDFDILGPTLLFPNDKVQHAGCGISVNGLADHLYLQSNKNNPNIKLDKRVTAITGACFFIKKDIYNKYKLDENFLVEFQDTDLCLNALKDEYKIVYHYIDGIYHHTSATRGTMTSKEAIHDRMYFIKKHKELLIQNDANWTYNLVPLHHEYFNKIAIKNALEYIKKNNI